MMTSMIVAAIILSLVSLAASLLVVRRMRASSVRCEHQSTSGRDLQHELIEAANDALQEAYGRIRRTLAEARNLLRQVETQTRATFDSHARLATEHADRLADMVEQGVNAIGHATVTAARQTEKAIASRVRRLKARAMLLLAEVKVNAARTAVIDQRFSAAEELLDETADLIRHASNVLAEENGYDLVIESVCRALREATTSLRSHAEFTVKKMDRLLEENNRIVEQLEAEEMQSTQDTDRASSPTLAAA